jgi:hypothetical protein
MKTLQRTSWFDGGTAPRREGPYERRSPAGPYSCWAQGRWWGDAPTPEAAARVQRPSRRQSAAWRGVTASSEGPCLACKGAGVVDLGVDDAGEDLMAACVACDPD